jgi:hypothetical protein
MFFVSRVGPDIAVAVLFLVSLQLIEHSLPSGFASVPNELKFIEPGLAVCPEPPRVLKLTLVRHPST